MKKILSMLLITIYFLIFVFGMRVKALELIEEPIDNVWYFRKGGGKKAFSAQFKYYSIDNKTTYCIEPGEHITTHNYEQSEMFDLTFTDEVNDLLKLIGYYGYDYPGHNTLKFRMATQALIWELTGGQTVEYWTQPSGSGTFINIDSEKSQIMELVNNHSDLPSFKNTTSNGFINGSVNFIDALNNLSAFKVLASNDYDYSISNNILTIVPKKVGLIEVNVERDKYTDNMTTYFVGMDEKSQTMGYFGFNIEDKFKVYVNSKGGYLNLKKIDSYNFNSIPRGDGKLEGAKYGVYDNNGNLIDEIIIGKNGTGVSKALGLGSYTLKELEAGLGYKVDEKVYNFSITSYNLNPSIKVTERVKSSTLELYKVKNNVKTGILEPEENIIFEIYLKSNNELMARTAPTDKDGYTSAFLPYGKYIVKQINTTEGYEKVDDFELDVTGEVFIKKVIADSPFGGLKLKVLNKNIDTNNLINNEVKFKIKNLDTNEYVCQNIIYPDNKEICEFKTVNGSFITPNNLIYGNYELEQVDDVIDGYLWNSEKIQFEVNDNINYKKDDILGNIIELDFFNKPVKGSLEINKYGEKIIYKDNNYSYENILLNKVSFELYAAEDIYSSDNNLIYKKDKLIKKFTTKNGKYTVNNLNLGKYYLKEVKNSEEYELNESPFYFEINYKDQYTPVVSIKFELKNFLKKGCFELLKLEKDSNIPIENTLIEIKNSNNDLVYSGYTDNNGKIILKDLIYDKYTYHEVKASDGYILDNIIYNFEINDMNKNINNIIYNEKIIVDTEEEKIMEQKEEDNITNEQDTNKDNIIIEEIKEEVVDAPIKEEIINVPITYINEINIINIISILLILIGIINAIIYKKEN